MVYDFSFYLRLREERRAAAKVAEAVGRVNHPGAVVELKRRVQEWMALTEGRRRTA